MDEHFDKIVDVEPEMTAALTQISEVRTLIAKCRCIDEAKEIRDKMQAIQVYLRQKRDSHDIQNNAAELKLRAERRIGEIIHEGRAAGLLIEHGRPAKRAHDEPFSPKTLEQAGIERNAARRYQHLALVPGPRFEQFLVETRDAGEEITTRAALAVARHLSAPEPTAPTAATRIEQVRRSTLRLAADLGRRERKLLAKALRKMASAVEAMP